MSLATFKKRDDVVINPDPTTNVSKCLSKCFGYMGIALAISAIIAVAIGLLFTKVIFPNYSFEGELVDGTPLLVFLSIMIGSYVVMIIDQFVIAHTFIRQNRSLWGPYIIYAVLMGVFLSSFIVFGVDAGLIGMAAGIAAVVFLALFLVGFTSKKDLTIASYIAWSILFSISLFGLFGLIIFLLIPAMATMFNLIFSLAFTIVLLLTIASDAYRIRQIIAAGQMNENVALYCAYEMYTDFIVLFLRILRILMIIYSSKDRS